MVRSGIDLAESICWKVSTASERLLVLQRVLMRFSVSPLKGWKEYEAREEGRKALPGKGKVIRGIEGSLIEMKTNALLIVRVDSDRDYPLVDCESRFRYRDTAIYVTAEPRSKVPIVNLLRVFTTKESEVTTKECQECEGKTLGQSVRLNVSF